MPYMRSVYGSAYVEIPEPELVTQEMTWSELQSLMGFWLAMEYIRVAPPIVIWRWLDAPSRDPHHGRIMEHAGWHSHRGWRVQYMYGYWQRAHLLAPPTPVQTVEPTVEPTLAPTPRKWVLRWRDNFSDGC
jgi:hypothetical protein